MRILTLIIIAVIFSGCALLEKKTNAVQQNDSIIKGHFSRSVPVATESRDTTLFSLGYSYLEQPSAYKNTIDSIVGDILSFYEISENVEPLKYIDSTTLRGYFERQVAEYKKEISEENYDQNAYLIDLNIDIDNQLADFCSLIFNGYAYFGGAHGNGVISYFLIERATGKVLKLNELVSDYEALRAIAKKHFDETYELGEEPDYNELGFWFEGNKYALNENFYITSESLVFVYNNYEIAPYSAGNFEVEIPIEEITSILQINLGLKE